MTFKKYKYKFVNWIFRKFDYPQVPCKSGAHTLGNCLCIGQAGLDELKYDQARGVNREWSYYYRRHG